MRSNLTFEQVAQRQKLRRILVFAVVGVGVLYAATSLFGETGMVRHYEMVKTHQDVSTKLAKTMMWNDVIEVEIDRMKNNPAQLEGLARTSLGMVREGEVVYQFVTPPQATPSSCEGCDE